MKTSKYQNSNRKAQGMPLNIIIIAVMCLLVLIVVIFIFAGKSTLFKKGVESCESKSGICVAKDATCNGPVIGYVPDVSCDNDKSNPPNQGAFDGEKCCLKMT